MVEATQTKETQPVTYNPPSRRLRQEKNTAMCGAILHYTGYRRRTVSTKAKH